MAGNPVPIAAIAEKLGVSADDVRAAADKLRQRYEERGGLRLLQFNHKLQLSSNPDYKDYIGAVLNPIKEREFTKPSWNAPPSSPISSRSPRASWRRCAGSTATMPYIRCST